MPDSPWSPGDEGPARLLEAARLASLGRLVPAVAHQLATPLASITLRAESLEGDLHGSGDDSVRPRLFEHLFSTQPPDRGLGLGLLACRLIAEQHSGSIECVTGHGPGGRFVLEIPSGPGAR